MGDSVMASAHAQYARAENLVLVLEFVKRSLLVRGRVSSAERAQRGFVKVGPWANATQYGWGKLAYYFFFLYNTQKESNMAIYRLRKNEFTSRVPCIDLKKDSQDGDDIFIVYSSVDRRNDLQS